MNEEPGQNERFQNFPPQMQDQQPGMEKDMDPRPQFAPFYPGTGKFQNQTVLISGGDSGIGRATALAFASEGANISIIYKNEHEDAMETKKLIEEKGTGCLLLYGDIGEEKVCREAVEKTVKRFGKLHILINNAAEQHTVEDLRDLSDEILHRTFQSNLFSMFYLTKVALDHIPPYEGCIINTTSVTAYRGSPTLLDYSATKGAIVAFTRSLSLALVEKGIRVNAVAPGPIWTPLIPASFDKERVAQFGKQTPMKRAGQPNEVAGCFTFLASKEASYITGQVLHPNGGEIINS